MDTRVDPVYDAGSVYESPEAAGFTKRLIFSGWAVVPKVVSSLVSFEAERRASPGEVTATPRTTGDAVASVSPSVRASAQPGESGPERRPGIAERRL